MTGLEFCIWVIVWMATWFIVFRTSISDVYTVGCVNALFALVIVTFFRVLWLIIRSQGWASS